MTRLLWNCTLATAAIICLAFVIGDGIYVWRAREKRKRLYFWRPL